MFIEGLTPEPLKGQVDAAPSHARREARLHHACQAFEQLFLQQMLAQMRKSVPKGGMFGNSQQEKMFSGMLDQQRAKIWSQEGGIGLANMLFQQMKKDL